MTRRQDENKPRYKWDPMRPAVALPPSEARSAFVHLIEVVASLLLKDK